MPRINIEDSLYKDLRFMNLLIKLGDHDRAIGALVRAWSLAQKWYVTSEKMIPLEEWKKQGIRDEIIEVGLAEKVDQKVRICGADEQFSWLTQRIEAGRKGGIARRDKQMPIEEQAKREGARIVLNKAVKSGEIIKPKFCTLCGSSKSVEGHHSDYSKPLDVDWLCKKCHTRIHWDIQEAVANQPLAVPKPRSQSLSPSLSLFPPQPQDSKSNTVPAGSQATTTGGQDLNRRIWFAYQEAYKNRYKTDPVRNATVNSQISNLGRRLGEDAIQVVRFFLTHSSGFYVAKCHPIGLCLADAESLHTQWVRGKAITRNDVREFEKTDSFRSQMERIESGEL